MKITADLFSTSLVQFFWHRMQSGASRVIRERRRLID
jgi:hypothetical protein